MRYFLGIDVGNTKSHALIADESGRAVGFGWGGPGNYQVVGWAGLRREMEIATREALHSAGLGEGDIVGAGFGIAGYDWEAESEPTMQAILALGLGGPSVLENDATLGLVAGAASGWGVVISAGTSNNCRGRSADGKKGRVTGCGPWAGEYGGASELVARAIQAVAKAWTLRGPATRITSAFIELAGATDVVDLLEGLFVKRYRITAAAAPLIFQLAGEGDAVAQETIHWAGCELGSLAAGVIRQLDFEDIGFEVVLSGSLFNSNSPFLLDPLRQTVHAVAPHAYFVQLQAPPVTGAVLLGMERVGLDFTQLRSTLIKTTNTLLPNKETLYV
jgi:N-acetylglucosamine kinase-like BadF-type ATPase